MRTLFTQQLLRKLAVAALLTAGTASAVQAQQAVESLAPNIRFGFNVTGYKNLDASIVKSEATKYNNGAKSYYEFTSGSLPDSYKTYQNEASAGWYLLNGGNYDQYIVIAVPSKDVSTLSSYALTSNVYVNNDNNEIHYTRDYAVGPYANTADFLNSNKLPITGWLNAIYGGEPKDNYANFNDSYDGKFAGIECPLIVKDGNDESDWSMAMYIFSGLLSETDEGYMTYEFPGSSQIIGIPQDANAAKACWDKVFSHLRFTESGVEENKAALVLAPGSYIAFGKERIDVVGSSFSVTDDFYKNSMTDEKDVVYTNDNEIVKSDDGGPYFYIHLEPGSQLQLGGNELVLTKGLTVTFDFAGNESVETFINSDKGSQYLYQTIYKDMMNWNTAQFGLTALFKGVNQLIGLSRDSEYLPITFDFSDDSENMPYYFAFSGNATGSDNNSTNIESHNGSKSVVGFNRTMAYEADGWYTLCVPFNIPADQLKAAFGSNVNLRQYNETVDNGDGTMTFKFQPATTVEAGHAYLIRPGKDFSTYYFKNVTVSNTLAPSIMQAAGSDTKYSFAGTFVGRTLDEFGDRARFFGGSKGTQMFKANAGSTLPATRCYFLYPETTTAQAKSLIFDLGDGTTTGISNIIVNDTNAAGNGAVYNLRGQRVGSSLSGLPRGIYIQNGKKVIK